MYWPAHLFLSFPVLYMNVSESYKILVLEKTWTCQSILSQNLFRPANGMRSTLSLVEIHNIYLFNKFIICLEHWSIGMVYILCNSALVYIKSTLQPSAFISKTKKSLLVTAANKFFDCSEPVYPNQRSKVTLDCHELVRSTARFLIMHQKCKSVSLISKI